MKPKRSFLLWSEACGRLIFAILLAVPCGSHSQQFYQNPVIAGDYPDPSVIHVGKDFWATATSSVWGPQFPLLHSTDLVIYDGEALLRASSIYGARRPVQISAQMKDYAC